MSNDIKVSPTPIQRNSLDVAVELTKLYEKSADLDSVEKIQDAFLKFYAVAETARANKYKMLIEYLPEDLKKAVNTAKVW